MTSDDVCLFCKDYRRRFMTDTKTNSMIGLISDNYLAFDNSDGKCKAGTIKIYYCPMCGRKLED
jgi:hypothetical protein